MDPQFNPEDFASPLPPRRSGETTQLAQRLGGCFMFFFGLPFLCGGLFFFGAALLGKINEGQSLSGQVAGAICGTLFSAVFVIIGAAITWGGLRGLAGWDRATQRPTAKPEPPEHYLKSKLFPAPKKPLAKGPRGGVLLDVDRDGQMSPIFTFIVSVIWLAASSFAFAVADHAPWIVRAFIALFVFIGVVMLFSSVKQLWRGQPAGEVELEARTNLLRPGETATFWLTFSKDEVLHNVCASLQQRERAVHGSGTDSVTHRETVYTALLFEAGTLRVEARKPAAQFTAHIPEAAMHSLKAKDNEVLWGIHITAGAGEKPDVDKFFPFLVAPEMPRSRT